MIHERNDVATDANNDLNTAYEIMGYLDQIRSLISQVNGRSESDDDLYARTAMAVRDAETAILNELARSHPYVLAHMWQLRASD
jgi:hypothetical protein